MTDNPDAERIARRFHERYEYRAGSFGWATQERSQVAWADLPDNQRNLMLQVVDDLLREGTICV